MAESISFRHVYHKPIMSILFLVIKWSVSKALVDSDLLLMKTHLRVLRSLELQFPVTGHSMELMII